MAEERQAYCKECGKPYSYSASWAETLAAEGRSPTEYCPRCRKIHSMERATVAVPYFVPRPTGPRRPDQELSPGRLGRLTHTPRDHHTVSIPAIFHGPDSGIDFGIKDPDIIELFEVLIQHKVTVVVGPTGSGKSTFLPYRLMCPPSPPFDDDLFTRYGQIVVTQPRIQATRTIPDFVARDLHGCTLGAGSDIGYIHRGDTSADRHSKLIYCTDGMLINWIASGRIAEFSIIMIDEAHERSLNIDVILGLLRSCLPLYPNLKLIIASATINSNLFIDHFKAIGPVGFKEFEGLKTYSYKNNYRTKKVVAQPRPNEMARAVADETIQLLTAIAGDRGALLPGTGEGATPPKTGWPEGDILAFLPTVGSIDEAAAQIRIRIKDSPLLSGRGIQVHALHRQLPLETQNLALQKKAKTIAGKILTALQAMAEGREPTGPILGLLLDAKSAGDTVQRVLKAMEGPDPLADVVPVVRFDKAPPDMADKRQVVVGTFDEVKGHDLSSYRAILFDRRVVVATNIAETSLTVDGIVYVVDSGLILRTQWDPVTLTESYPTEWHSKDGCRQRWGRAGRVRDGWARCLYTEDQFKQFEDHTSPEIERAPLEAAIMTAKSAGVDDVVSFPWIQPPEEQELKRAEVALKKRGLLDAEGDLTEYGQVVARVGDRPNTGHLVTMADQFACAIEMVTLVSMLKLRLRGGLLRWHHQWDGHTRRQVRRIHEALAVGCRDDVEFLLKIYQAWSESSLPDYDWLTDEAFVRLWPDRVPGFAKEQEQAIGRELCEELTAAASAARTPDDLSELVSELILPKLSSNDRSLANSWLTEAKVALRNTRRSAWARRFFVNHAMLMKAEAERDEMLVRLSIGKKAVESRPLDFDIVLQRTKLVMACAWPDQVYLKSRHGYHADHPERATRETGFVIEMGRDSLFSSRGLAPELIVAGQRSAGTQHVGNGPFLPAIRLGLIAELDPTWRAALGLPTMELGQWMAVNLPHEEIPVNAASKRILIDQSLPLSCTCACRPVLPREHGQLRAAISDSILPPPLVEETTPEGEIIWMEEVVAGVDNDLDARAGADEEVKAIKDPEAEDPLAGHEIDEEPRRSPPSGGSTARPTGHVTPGVIVRGELPKDQQTIRARIIGYDLSPNQPARVQLAALPEEDPFQALAVTHPDRSMIRARSVELEETPGDEQVSLVSILEGTDLEVVLEASDITFAARYAGLRRMALDRPFSAIVEAIVPEHQRVYLSCLPLLEPYLPPPGATLDGVVIENTDSGIHVSLQPEPADLPLGLTAFCATADVPESLRQSSVGEHVRVRIETPTEHHKHSPSLDPTLLELLAEAHWQDHVSWNSNDGRLTVKGRLSDQERHELLQRTSDPRQRRTINDLYRLSNALQAQVDMSAQLAAYAQHVQADALVSATIVKAAKHEILISLADGVRAKVTRADVERAVGYGLREGQKIDVTVKAVDPIKGYATVAVADPAARIRQRYTVGQVVPGRILRLVDDGAFIEFEAKIQGWVAARDLSWCKVTWPGQMFDRGDEVLAKITNISTDGKMDVTLRIEENRPEKRFAVGSQVKAKIVGLQLYGAFARVGPGVVGLIHQTEMAWQGTPIPAQVVTPGQPVTVRVLGIDGDPCRVNLSLRSAFKSALRVSSEELFRFRQRRGAIGRAEIETKTSIREVANGTIIISGSSQHALEKAEEQMRELLKTT